jgi:hypothetical protein
MKILFVQTNYPGFLNDFYNKNKDWQNLRYSKLVDKLQSEWFGSSCFYSKHLSKLGWDAHEVIINDWNLQSKWAGENNYNITQREPNLFQYFPASLKRILGMQQWINTVLDKQINRYKPDVIYLFNMKLFNSSFLQHLKNHSKLLVGQIASPLPSDTKLLSEFDLILSSFPHFVRQFKKMGINSEYLKWCFEHTITRKIGKQKRAHNVTYVGGFSPAHRKGNRVLEQLARSVKTDFWGYGKNTLLPKSPIRANFHGHAWGRDMYNIFAKSKIVVNRHIDISNNYANNMRMFEATGMGALLITEEKKNMDVFFKVGKEVVTYKSVDELIKKVKYYLKHDKEREKIAHAGQKRTLKDHTYEIRMRELDSILRSYLKRSNR